MTPQQAGVSAEAVGKLIERWRKGANDKELAMVAGFHQTDMLTICADELEALATAPPEQAATVANVQLSATERGSFDSVNTQPQAVSAGALYASGEMVRCSQCLMPLSGAPESHLPECKTRELQEQHEANLLAAHDQKVRERLLVDVLEILAHATCERPEGKSWLLGPGEVWAAVRALGEKP